jgi:arylsulfatase
VREFSPTRWDSLSWDEKKLFIKQADVYGAYQAYTDHEIGRVIQAVEDLGQLDNTLIIYISGDNGGSAEGMVNGTPNEFTTFNGIPVPVKDQFLWYEFWGSERSFPHFSAGWARAFDTPFKWMKQVPSHFGGTAQGVAMSWPGHIDDVGGIRRQFTTSSTSFRPSSKPPASRRPTRSTASSSFPSKA